MTRPRRHWHAVAALPVALTLLAMPIPAWAQDHAHMHMPAPRPATPARKRAASAPATPAPAMRPPATHAHAATPVTPADTITAAAPVEVPVVVDHSQMDHAQMDHAQMVHAPMPADAGNLPRTPIPPITAADREAARPPTGGHAAHDAGAHGLIVIDRLEAFDTSAGTGGAWEVRGWYGGDVNRAWIRSEGEQVDGRTERADVEAFYGRATSAWWEVLAGVRHDSAPGASKDFLAFGVQGLAPYKIEVAATAYLGSGGQGGVRAEAEYETLFTNRLILQSRVEANFWAKNDPARGVGAGLSTFEAGLRLRYHLTRRFAPYIGVQFERAVGETARLRTSGGHDASDTRFVVGIHAWF